MKLNVKKLLFGAVFVCVAALCVWRAPLSVQTNLNSLIATNNTDWPVDELTNKFSNVVNILVKSENLTAAKAAATAITETIATDDFGNFSPITTDVSIADTVRQLNEHRNSFLSAKYRKILLAGDYATITDNAVATVSGSMAPTVLSLADDPFLLATNYIGELRSVNGRWNTRDGFLWQYVAPHHYILISANVNSSDDNLAENINSLSHALAKFNTADTHVYLSGIPVHTANMTMTSKLQLSVFSFIALAMAILLNWLLFRGVATMLPVVLSLAAGFVAGALALFLFFAEPHILTFVFGVTLIGLGIDYSFHFISAQLHRKDRAVRQNIWHSFLTTVVCFLPLAFSGVSLLQQISVFTIVGLTAIYTGWLIFMPKKISAKPTEIKMPRAVTKKYRPAIIVAIVVAICATMPFMRAQNNMSQMYRPNAELLTAESLMGELNGGGASKFLMIRGNDLDDALRTAETIRDESGDFFDLSTIIPSATRQGENQNLVRALYTAQAKRVQNELGLRKTPKFTETPPIQLSDITGNKTLANLLDKFMFNDGKYTYLVANIDADITPRSPNAIVVSPAQQMTDLMATYSHTAYKLLVMCGVVLILLLMTIYGRMALVYLMPSVLAVGMTAAVLTWFGQPITFFHLLSLFIVIGLTLDYSIFHINATDNRQIKPVLFSFLTSLIGFGILGFASFFLIRSMGITLGIGLTFGYLISLFLFCRQN